MMSEHGGVTGVFRSQGNDKRTGCRRNLVLAGFMLVILMLFISTGSAENSTDLTTSNITTSISNPGQAAVPFATSQILNPTTIPTTLVQNTSSAVTLQILNVTTIPTTLVQNITTIPAKTVQNATAIPTAIVRNTTNIPTTLAQTATTVPTTQILSAGSGVNDPFNIRVGKRVSQAEKEAAADRFKEIYQTAETTETKKGASGNGMDPGGIPHYFGPYANYANSPMPTGSITTISLENGGSDYSVNTTARISDVYGTGTGANASVNVTAGVVTSITLINAGSGYSAPIVTITDADSTGSGAVATASIGGPLTGGIRKFIDSLPGLNIQGANNLGNYIPVAIPDTTTYPPGGKGYTSAPAVLIYDATGSGANATATVAGGTVTGVAVINPGSGYSANPVVAFSGGGAATNAIGKATVVGGAITGITLVGCDYYVIELGEFSQKMHSDLPSTKFRGYRQVNTADPAVSSFHYLGPLILSQSGRPVRIKFINSLPTGAGGNLFIPVDKTVMGAGMGPLGSGTTPGYPEYYTENRAVIHLHGGVTPWLSDGTPHQWITPAGEKTDYPKGVSVYNVPDMPDPGDGSTTLYYTNQQSARLMFMHDHVQGLTRLNVYVGEAAGYLVTDQVEKDMIDGTDLTGINPARVKVLPDIGFPLMIQDKTFLDTTTIALQDPTWNWGTGTLYPNGTREPRTGDLWYPHVYMPAQNPGDMTGVNAFGRWHYGPWFWPPTQTIYGPVPNPYYTGGEGTAAPWEPAMMPGTPNPSMAMEAFMDTPLVNGVAYPNITVEPRAYRFRLLNAADDRFVNLQLYVANDTLITADGRTNTEVDMVPAIVTPGFPAGWPSDGREGGVPDPAKMGPSFIQIGTEGGFLPAPVVVPNQPITWVSDPTRFDFGNVDKHALLIAPAERADVIIDFSQYAGKTLILYNDAPAAFPAGIASYDYYTGKPDLTDTGGTPTTLPGFGPNTRTIMQIKVGPSVGASPYNVAALQSVFAKTATKRGVFEVSEEPIIIPQAKYNSAYNKVFPTDTYVRIQDHFKNFTTLSGARLQIYFQPKALHDEMGAAFDEYGRMSGFLGLENVITTANLQNFQLYGYASPPVDILKDSVTPVSEPVEGDGTQIWKITHNGVDTHPLHWHLYNVQIINRVTWDGRILEPDATELGWKETLRVSPLEDTIVAMRPVAPNLPFDVPNSIRMIDPTMPEGAVLSGPPLTGFVDPAGQPVTVINHMVNYGWEYVWHCHILAHEEMDMMHSMIFAKAPVAPSNLTATLVGTSIAPKINITWRDTSLGETHFTIQKAVNPAGPWTDTTIVSTTGPKKDINVTYTDSAVAVNTTYYYRVFAINLVGDTTVYPAPAVGFPSMSVNSKLSNTVSVATSVPPPTFTAIIPDNGVRSTTVSYTIIGTNFEPGLTSVAFRSTTGTILNPTTLTSVTPTQITGTIAIPAKSAFGSYTVSITTVHGGTVTRIGAFSVTPPPPAPMLIRVTPATATRNAVWSYSVFGTNLQFGQPTVTLTRSGFPDIPTTVTSVTPTVIQGNILIPASTSPGMWGIKVTTNGGTATTRNSVRIQ
jgi:FtsP/CotA-like multicopper oxidase with cupredoxin domain